MSRKKPWTRNQKLIVAGIIALFILPLYKDIYNFYKSKSYRRLKENNNNLIKSFSDNTSILGIRPLTLKPYMPKPGSYKGLIIAEIKIKNKKLANNIKVNFEIDPGIGEKVDSEGWDAIANQKSLIFSMFYPDERFVRWTPNIPAGIEEIAKRIKNPFKLWLTVTWQDIDKREHKIISYSELRFDENSKFYYFDERENKWVF